MATQKVMDINQIQSVQTPDELIGKVQDYIIQSRVGNKAEVQMAFHHESLGQVDLVIQKLENQMNVAINAHTTNGKNFFNQHQTELLRTLNQAGVQIGDFKVDMPFMNLTQSSSSSSDSSSSRSGQQEFSSFSQQRGQHQSQSGQRDQESQRREELWKYYQDKEVA